MGDMLHATVLARDKTKSAVRVVTGMREDGIVRRKDGIPARMKYYGMHGVDYISHHKEAQHHRDKVIEYEQATVARSPLTIARVQAAATVFDFPGVKRDCVLSLTVSACVAMLSLLFAVDDRAENALQALTDIGTVVSQGLFFLLGPYLGLCLARWWQMRLDFVGGVWGVVADLNTWAATWFHSGSDADKAARRLMLRYGLAAHMLLFKGARGDDEQLDAMVKAGLLTSREQRQLQGSEAKGIPGAPSKSQMIFAWIVAFWSRALAPDQGGLGTTRIQNAEQLAPMVLRRCADGRGAAGGALALVFTQLPLAYVHLLSLLVRFASIVNAITHGANAGNTLSSPVCGDEIKAAAAGMPRFQLFFPRSSEAACAPALYEQSAAASVTIILSWLVAVVMYPIIYNGLFSIGVMISNPLGNNSINFCGSWYQHIMKDEMINFTKCIDGISTQEAIDAEVAEVQTEARKAKVRGADNV